MGYTVPKSFCRRLGINSFRVYFAGENLFMLSARKGMDPRYSYGIGGFSSGTGMASGSYSALRTITGGLTLSF